MTIFTEGRWDKPFVAELIKRHFGEEQLNKIELLDTNGYTSLELNLPKFQENNDLGKLNLVIFDADSADNNGGFQTRFDFLVAEKARLGIEFEFFLFPNHLDDGMFENLLESIVNPNHADVIECFNSYLECIRNKGEDKGVIYTLPAQKAKIFAYAEAVLTPKEFKNAHKRKEWGYSKDDIWDFNSAQLNPLIEFLKLHIQV